MAAAPARRGGRAALNKAGIEVADAPLALAALAGLMRRVADGTISHKLVDDVMAANAAIVAEFRAGKDKAFNSLVG